MWGKYSGNRAIAAAPVKPVIGESSVPLAVCEFSLISFDKSGHRQPLPSGLGDLPLYPDDDGYFSVNGSLDFTLFSPHTALAPIGNHNHSTIRHLASDIPGFSGENPHVTSDPHSGHSNADTIPGSATPPHSPAPHHESLSNGSVVGSQHTPRGGVTTALNLVALGDPHSQRSRHWTATTRLSISKSV